MDAAFPALRIHCSGFSLATMFFHRLPCPSFVYPALAFVCLALSPFVFDFVSSESFLSALLLSPFALLLIDLQLSLSAPPSFHPPGNRPHMPLPSHRPCIPSFALKLLSSVISAHSFVLSFFASALALLFSLRCLLCHAIHLICPPLSTGHLHPSDIPSTLVCSAFYFFFASTASVFASILSVLHFAYLS